MTLGVLAFARRMKNGMGAGLVVEGRTMDDGQPPTVTWIIYVPPSV